MPRKESTCRFSKVMTTLAPLLKKKEKIKRRLESLLKKLQQCNIRTMPETRRSIRTSTTPNCKTKQQITNPRLNASFLSSLIRNRLLLCYLLASGLKDAINVNKEDLRSVRQVVMVKY